jgi:hypothetical protein
VSAETSIIEISASSWAHDFAPVFGLGRTMTYEIPQPEVLTTKDVAADAVNHALKSFADAESKVRSGEWLEACNACHRRAPRVPFSPGSPGTGPRCREGAGGLRSQRSSRSTSWRWRRARSA